MGGGGGGGGEGSLSDLRLAITITFVISLLAILAQFFYALWRRRVCADNLTINSSSASAFSSSKLLYFFRIKRHSDSVAVAAGKGDPSSNLQSDMEIVDIDLLKLQEMFGPPRFLFTINEEEEGDEEERESPAEKSINSEAKKIENYDRDSSVSLEECFRAADSAVELEAGCAGDNATPFSTPCFSPE